MNYKVLGFIALIIYLWKNKGKCVMHNDDDTLSDAESQIVSNETVEFSEVKPVIKQPVIKEPVIKQPYTPIRHISPFNPMDNGYEAGQPVKGFIKQPYDDSKVPFANAKTVYPSQLGSDYELHQRKTDM